MRPTERQIQRAKKLDSVELTDLALRAMFTLNRRAKKKRDNYNRYRGATFSNAVRKKIDEIYRIKDDFLDALIRRGVGDAFYFHYKRTREFHQCPQCGNQWGPTGDTCYNCGAYVEPDYDEFTEKWYLIKVEDTGERVYSFHLPEESASKAIKKNAKEIKSHDPNQEYRKIPDIDLTIEAQKKIVRMATNRLGQKQIA